MFLIYNLSLSIFPGFLAEDTGSHSLGSCMQVRTCLDRKLQRLGPDWEIPASDRLHQADISEGAASCDLFAVPVRPCILLHSEIW
uniref:Uncharacterized protein n=1 Tax=Arundo donax TaxID=35708 RepID=A0A0A8Y2J5_ARUDO